MTIPMSRFAKGLAMSIGIAVSMTAAARADISVSQSNDPSAAMNAGLAALLGAEHEGLGAVSATRLSSLARVPSKDTAKPGDEPAFDEAWVAAQGEAEGDAQFECLATALYFEARGESVKGQAAVAEVILNRAESGEFPRSVCGVVNQKGNGGCQFSYTCDGMSDRIREPEAWERARKVARAMLDGAPRGLTDGATYFHTPAVRPGWSRRFERTAQIGRHIFYRAPIRTAMN